MEDKNQNSVTERWSLNMSGIYIHIPFCKKKCNYCDFASCNYGDFGNDYIDRYLNALSDEIDTHQLSTLNSQLSTIYIGGGTPSILSCTQIEYLFNTLYNSLCPNKCSEIIPSESASKSIISEQMFGNKTQGFEVSEITFECNPESIDEEKLEALKSFGVNRLSFGAQSFKDSELKYLGRAHTSKDFYEKYKIARNKGFDNIGLDLIYGLPDQEIESWKENLKKAVELCPEHISIYPLTIENNTAFFSDGVITSDEKQATMFNEAREFLVKKKYSHYEISNFSLDSYQSKHNLNYWRCGEYLGFGVSAASYIGNARWKNTDDIVKYVGNPTDSKEILLTVDNDDMISDRIFLGLRLLNEGVDIDDDIKGKYQGKISELQKSGLIIKDKNRIRLTRNSVYVSNRIMSEFV